MNLSVSFQRGSSTHKAARVMVASNSPSFDHQSDEDGEMRGLMRSDAQGSRDRRLLFLKSEEARWMR